MQILLPILFFAGVYFLLLRPQQQRVRRQRELITAIGVGDRVVTAGGLIGRVIDENDDRLLLEVSDGVVVEFLRLAISRRLDETESSFALSPGDDLEELYAEDAEPEAAESGATTDPVVAAVVDAPLGAAPAGDPAVVAPEPAGEPATATPIQPVDSTGSDTSKQGAPAPGQDPH